MIYCLYLKKIELEHFLVPDIFVNKLGIGGYGWNFFTDKVEIWCTLFDQRIFFFVPNTVIHKRFTHVGYGWTILFIRCVFVRLCIIWTERNDCYCRVDALQGISKSRVTWNECIEVIKNKTSIILQLFTGLNI